MDKVKTCLVYEIWQDHGSQLWDNELILFIRALKDWGKNSQKNQSQAFVVTLKKHYYSNNRWKIIFTKVIKYGKQILYIFPAFINLVNIN